MTTPAPAAAVPSLSLKAHDRLPYIEAILGFEPDLVADLTTADEVRFIMRDITKPTGPPKVNGIAMILDATTGEVRYEWAAGDTDLPGVYNAEWQVTYSDGLKQTFPTLTYHRVNILADLDGA